MSVTVDDEATEARSTPASGRPVSVDPADVGTREGAADDVAVTGPMPVIDLAGGHLHLTERRGVTILEIDGGLDDTLAASIVPLIDAALDGVDAVVVDLDHTTLLDRSAVEAVCDVIAARGPALERCVVTGRLSARLVLERWDIPVSFVVFSSVPDALQAREFVASGYGPGWTRSEDLRN